MAAVLAAGAHAVLSHRSAAALWRIRETSRANVEVTAPRRCRRPGIEAREAILASDEITVERGVPVTNPARMLLDRGETVTKSVLERRFLTVLDAHGIPRPRTNQPLGPYEPDAVWPNRRLVVELDSYDIHTTREAFEADRERDRHLQTIGYRVVRITWRQLQSGEHALARQLRTLLALDTVAPP